MLLSQLVNLLPFDNSADLVAVLDGCLGFLHAGFEFTEAVGDGELEETTIRNHDFVAPTDDVTLGGTRLIMLIFVEGRIGHEAYGEAVVAEERALQGEGIAVPRTGVGIDIHRAVAKLTKGIGGEEELPRQFLREIDIVEQVICVLAEDGIGVLGIVIREVEIRHERRAVKGFPLDITLHLPAVLAQVVAVCAVAQVALRIDE